MDGYTFKSKNILTLTDKESIIFLINECKNHDNFLYDFQSDAEEIQNLPQFFFCYHENKIVGSLSLFPEDEDTLTLYAIVHPLHRKKGIFTSLFTLFSNTMKQNKSPYQTLEFHITNYTETDNANTTPALIILKKNNFRLSHNEYLLSYSNTTDNLLNFKSSLKSKDIPTAEYDEEHDEFLLYLKDEYIGGCFIYKENYATIFQFEILKEFRGKGYGKSGLFAILSQLNTMGYYNIILHVSGKNKIAHNLYTSCGFITKSSLSIFHKSIYDK